MDSEKKCDDNINKLFEQLYCKICGSNNKDSLVDVLETSFAVNSHVGSFIPYDDIFLTSRAKKLLSDKSPALFSFYKDLHKNLTKCTSLEERSPLLTFLLLLTETREKTSSYVKQFSSESNSFIKMEIHPSEIGDCKIEEPKVKTSKEDCEKSTLLSEISSDIDNSFKFIKTPPEIMQDCVQNVIYSFLGTGGTYLKKNNNTGSFTLNEDAYKLSVNEREMVLRLSKLGFYHNQIKKITTNTSEHSMVGLMGQGYIGVLETELTKYYGMVAILEDRFRVHPGDDMEENFPSEKITLIALQMWVDYPIQRLECLNRISNACKNGKGGALASVIYSFLSYGDPLIKEIANKLLVATCGPLGHMLIKWILEGIIFDPHEEFFIESLSEISLENLWHEKYRIRSNMLPIFISKDLANKILVTGKSINFLRQVCKDTFAIPGREQLKKCFVNQRENIFSRTADTELHIAMNTVYMNTSKRVLNIITGQYKINEHFVAMKQFMLLGEGDFIDCFLKFLGAELEKPGKGLHRRDLASSLDTAIRSTNARYIDPNISNLLDVKLIDPKESDIGWDVFYFHYNVPGPLLTILQHSMDTYRILFKPLCRMKHIKFILSSVIWQTQMKNARLLRSIKKEIDPILCCLHLQTTKFIHLIQEIQYYVLFEVIECAWIDFQKKIKSVETIDEILLAHDELLGIIKSGVFLDSKSCDIRELFENVYKNIYQFDDWQKSFFKVCFCEQSARRSWPKDSKDLKKIKMGQHEIVNNAEYEKQQSPFSLLVNNYQETLNKIVDEYQIIIGKLLNTLRSNNNPNLQLLAVRIDFNEYYRSQDQSD